MDSHCSKWVKETDSVPSFSSILLDSIYNSIEEGDEKMVLYNETMKKKNTSSYERAYRVEKWMETTQVSKIEVVTKKSALDFESKSLRNDNALFIKSSSSGSGSGSGYSDSSSGGGFSSSETESIKHGVKGSCYGLPLPKPKPVKKASINVFNDGHERRDLCAPQEKPKSETKFLRSKSSRAVKIYGDLKKVKQPISPGGRVSSFLNYLFAAGNTKKTSNNEIGSERTPKSANESTCSTASSFSRSCLSNSRGKSNNVNKRTVRFYPVSVIVDEDCQPCGEKKLYDHNEDKNYRVDRGARTEREFDRREYMIRSHEFSRANDEEDDESCASSDLFELDNLYAIGNGMDRYRQELPVYESTRVHSNTSMAKGLKLVKIEAM